MHLILSTRSIDCSSHSFASSLLVLLIISPEAELSFGGAPCTSQRRSPLNCFYPDSCSCRRTAHPPTTLALFFVSNTHLTPYSSQPPLRTITHMILLHTGSIFHEFLTCLASQPRHDSYLPPKTLHATSSHRLYGAPHTSQVLPLASRTLTFQR